MEPITPPIDIFEIDKLPYDDQKEIALNLSYEEIINLCRTRKILSNICKDPYFWKDKLIQDYPEVNIIGLKGEEFRAKYELRLAHQLDNEAKEIEYKIVNKKIPELKVIDDELREKESKIITSHEKRNIKHKNIQGMTSEYTSRIPISEIPEADELLDKKEKIKKKYNKQINMIRNKAKNLRRKAYPILPRTEEIEYFHIDLPINTMDNLDIYKYNLSSYPGSTKNRNKQIIDIIKEKLGPNYIPKTGHLIGLFSDSEIPHYLIYVYDNDGILDYDITYISPIGEVQYYNLPLSLQREHTNLINKGDYTSLNSLYNLDFSILSVKSNYKPYNPDFDGDD